MRLNLNPDAATRWLIAAFAANFLAVGVPFWLIPYRSVNLPDALLGPGLALVALSALLLRVPGVASLRRAGTWMGAAVVAAVMARVLVEVILDPTAHNLWPFEVVIAAALGFPLAFAGALAGALVARILSE